MIELTRFTLPNGLRVVNNYDPSVAMAVVQLLYNVGSRDENPDQTGVAHLFEHMMFGGSRNVADYDSAISAAGGHNNAWTSSDFTSFYDVLPAHNVETAFWAESDRMLALNVNAETLKVQRSVVIEEFKQQCLNRPYGDLAHHLYSLIYKHHPYRWPVIGLTPDHVASFSLDDAHRFYESHYAPNNAVLVVGGNVTPEQTLKLAQRWFGDIPRRDVAPRLYHAEPTQTAEREKTVKADVPQTVIFVAYPMCAANDPDYPAVDIITDILASGRSSRLYRELLYATDLFSGIDASVAGSAEPGTLKVVAQLRESTPENIARARSLIDQSLKRLIDQPVTSVELQRSVNRMVSNRAFSQIDLQQRVQQIALDEMQGIDINAVVPRYRALTPDDIASAAIDTLRPERRNTLIYGPV